ncbi:chemotaxis protein CheD [Thiorhodococcus minor]|uniref:Probable chemoreceptor glutamine deamidase CheD n=1 Tax=Thiorhodococcus minor TaxID=57489 RepID=A0A6M0JZN2_9GAMM|nr:chemotaxis protein CheD [Thiorhodococcus minor]NEV61787.1 chemotaxis protein CheD [Thiorhodococcus minor]
MEGLRRVRKRFLRPGEHCVTREPMMLSTLLGSCVAVCLFDPVAHVSGMNHFLLPVRNPAAGPATLDSNAGRYGLWAMEILIDNKALKLGARRERLRAKAFGGANVLQVSSGALPERYSIGTANVQFVRRFLEQDGIPLVAQDLGGLNGRQIYFYGGDYSVYLRRVPRSSTVAIIDEERGYLRHAIAAKQRKPQVDFFEDGPGSKA